MEKKDNQTTLIVTGTVRSGTSVMMRTLHESGIRAIFDDYKKPNESNPHGYFELKDVYELKRRAVNKNLLNPAESTLNTSGLSLERDQNIVVPAWLENARGGVVKILPNPLLQGLPLDRKYGVIFMRRNPAESAESFWRLVNSDQVALYSFPRREAKEEFVKKWEKILSDNSDSSLNYLKQNPDFFSVIEVDMHEINEKIEEVSKFIKENLGVETNLKVPLKDY